MSTALDSVSDPAAIRTSAETPARYEDLESSFFHSILDCIYEAVCVIDAEGIVKFWNCSSESLYGVPREAILGRSVLEFFPNALVDKVRRSRQAEKNIKHTPREGSHILTAAMPLMVNNVFMGAVCSDRDYAEVSKLYTDLEEARSRLGLLEIEVKKLSEQFTGILGRSTCFLTTLKRATQIAPSHANVLLSGASGTGKELFARKIHELSGRNGLFVPVNCSAIPPELFESEFFGYAPGAFTGASHKGKPGFFEMADKGTLFLDEVGELPLSMQAKLLRVLQERELVRVGGAQNVHLNVRVVAATNRNLEDKVGDGSFREDLYYRLHVVDIRIPSLCERQEDIPVLIDYYLKEFSQKNGMSTKSLLPETAKILCEYHWPGNVRELMNVVENMVVTSSGSVLTPQCIPSNIRAVPAPAIEGTASLDLGKAISRLEENYLRRALCQARDNKVQAARLLNMPRATLYHKIEQYGLLRSTNSKKRE